MKLLSIVRNKLFGQPYIHVEPFYKESFSSDNPLITGWVSSPDILIRAIVNSAEYYSTSITRPDVPYAFCIQLPKLDRVNVLTLEYSSGKKWKCKARFKRKFVKNTTPDKSKFIHYQKGVRKAILIHAFYPDILLEYQSLLASLEKPFDLYIYVPHNSPVHQKLQAEKFEIFACKKIIIGKSNGRDAGGFLTLLQYILAAGYEYDALLVMQTKKSPQFPASIGKAWRNMLLQPLIGSPLDVDNALSKLFAEKKINLIGTEDFVQKYKPKKGKGNYSRYFHLCELFSQSFHGTEFIAGTMFWMKFSILKERLPLAQLQTAIDLLEPGASEPSYAHAWERFIGRIATSGGGKIARLEYPSAFSINYNFFT